MRGSIFSSRSEWLSEFFSDEKNFSGLDLKTIALV
jgi:hypothetical protein